MSLTPSMIQLLEADENGRDYKASWTGDEKLTWIASHGIMIEPRRSPG